MFQADFFINNRQKIMTLQKSVDFIFIAGNSLMQRNSDSHFPFRQDSSFWYLTGVEEPGALLCIDIKKGKSTIILPEKSQQEVIFDGQRSLEEVQTTSGVDNVVQGKAGLKSVFDIIQKNVRVGVIEVSKSHTLSIGSYVAQKQLLTKLKRALGARNLISINTDVMRLRIKKSPEELDALRVAADITVEGFKQVHASLAGASYEYSLEAVMTQAFNSQGAPHAYNPIIASGRNACTLHYDRNNESLAQNQFVLLDCGAECSNYASDVTRTYSVGSVSMRHRNIWDAVHRTHLELLSFVGAGMTLIDVEHRAVELLSDELVSLGLLSSNSSDEVRRYFPHSVSHFVGLDVHDVGAYDMPLEPGMVFTIEPGIYIQEEGIGVRIEDTVVITPSGIENLTSEAPY